MERTDITFASQGINCAAWLYRPEGPGPFPCVVIGHGLGATREMGLDGYAQRFAASGLAALVFDYRHFGASEGEPRQLLDIQRQLTDWKTAVAYARTIADVDPERIALWGSSFSGGHVLVIAGQDQRIAAIVSQIPFTDGSTTLAAQSFLGALQLSAAGLRDLLLHQLLRRSPYYVKVIGELGSLAALATIDAVEGYHSIAPPEAWDDEIAARILLHIPFYRPIQSAPRIQAPTLFCICDQDLIASPQAALKTAQAIAHSEVHHYPGGHFAIYQEPVFEQAVTIQCDFLKRHLLSQNSIA